MITERRRFGFVARSTVSSYRLAPRIVLVQCWQCAGAGSVQVVRNRRETREPCAQCAGRGTIVRDDA